ncbi:hypothetical protein EVAR_53612_1 [Eumeta japonica]|uniref:Uncharacterized protein n=1 Tax=Eumeta variegata TaxID=151549 RepID=A0A4C1X2E6_EUMVA|nr:hypothetical protein EVAR_53612_1 [Eumeta japonica]
MAKLICPGFIQIETVTGNGIEIVNRHEEQNGGPKSKSTVEPKLESTLRPEPESEAVPKLELKAGVKSESTRIEPRSGIKSGTAFGIEWETN